ncbi:MAG: fibronectin type III domain-containing protein [Planctomycetaceae bacterium]|nr:fibronectin type III domain-containing protein [Planctomycetaceae bacterium]
MPLNIGGFTVNPGSNPLSIKNFAETRLGGIVAISPSLSLTEQAGSKFVLTGTQDQIIYTPAVDLKYHLDKPAGTITLLDQSRIQSDLLRDSNEIDPRTATLLDIVVGEGANVTLTGNVACRSTTVNGTQVTPLTIPSGMTLDSYSVSATGGIGGSGKIRVCAGKYSSVVTFGGTIEYWNDSASTPETPTGLTAKAINHTSDIELSWNSVVGATSYVVAWSSTNGTGSFVDLPAVAVTIAIHQTGVFFKRFYYRVKAVNDFGSSAYTSPSISEYTPPAAPTPGTPSVVSSSQIDLSWTPSAGAVGTKVQRSTDETNWIDVYSGSSTTASATGLAANTLYYFQLAAFNSDMAFSQFATTSATTLASAIQTAPTLTAGTATVNSLPFTWNSVTGATGYCLERLNGSNWESIYIGANLSYTNTELNAGTDYSYRVYATNSGGDSPASNVLTVRTLCAAPTGVTVTALDQTTDIKVSWATTTGAESYDVQAGPGVGGPYETIGQVNAPTQTITHKVGTVNTARSYRVNAVNASGSSAYSSVVNTKTAPAAPTNLIVGTITQNSVALSWTAPTGATKNKIEYEKDNTGNWDVFGVPGSGTSQIVTGLDPNTKYNFRVSSDNL